LVATRRRLAPAEAAQIHREHAVAIGEQWHQRAPCEPVLRPPVQEQHRRTLSELGDMQASAAHVDETVLDALELGHVRVGH
jgi:hypothetical protein